jgi:hypothetical protein
MAEKPSHVSRVSLSYPVEIGLTFVLPASWMIVDVIIQLDDDIA